MKCQAQATAAAPLSSIVRHDVRNLSESITAQLELELSALSDDRVVGHIRRLLVAPGANCDLGITGNMARSSRAGSCSSTQLRIVRLRTVRKALGLRCRGGCYLSQVSTRPWEWTRVGSSTFWRPTSILSRQRICPSGVYFNTAVSIILARQLLLKDRGTTRGQK
jgi:hypothetical protein